MDLGGLAEGIIMILIAAVAAALVASFMAAAIAARAGGVNRLHATVVGFGLGVITTLAVGCMLLLYATPWAWTAYLAGVIVANASAKWVIGAAPPQSPGDLAENSRTNAP